MSRSGTATAHDRVHADGEWWVLVVADGLTIEFPPELYRDHDAARGEAERWARVLSRRSRSPIERPFEDRWHVGDEWIRLTHTFLPEEGPEIWVITYWTRDGYPEPEAELIADAAEARAWVLEARAGAVLVESHDTPWSAAARFRVRGGEEEAEAHRSKIVAGPDALTSGGPLRVFGYEVSEGLIPQGPILFRMEPSRDTTSSRPSRVRLPGETGETSSPPLPSRTTSRATSLSVGMTSGMRATPSTGYWASTTSPTATPSRFAALRLRSPDSRPGSAAASPSWTPVNGGLIRKGAGGIMPRCRLLRTHDGVTIRSGEHRVPGWRRS